jgi:hypothetical protein
LDYTTRWTQCPQEDAKGYGIEKRFGMNENNKDEDDDEDDDLLFRKLHLDINYKNLERFLNASSLVFDKLFQEKTITNENSFEMNTDKIEIKFSRAFATFTIPKFLTRIARTWILKNCAFCQEDSNYFVCVYNIQQNQDNNNKNDNFNIGHFNASIFIVWNLNQMDQPYRILINESASESISYTSFLIFSGNCDGSVSVWDLRESFHLHTFYSSSKKLKYQDIRSPTYSTAGVLFNENHKSEVTSIIPLQNDNKIDGKKIFMQLATLEIDCKIIIWVIISTLRTKIII